MPQVCCVENIYRYHSHISHPIQVMTFEWVCLVHETHDRVSLCVTPLGDRVSHVHEVFPWNSEQQNG